MAVFSEAESKVVSVPGVVTLMEIACATKNRFKLRQSKISFFMILDYVVYKKCFFQCTPANIKVNNLLPIQ